MAMMEARAFMPLPAVLFRDNDPEESQLAHLLRQLDGELFPVVQLPRDRPDFRLGERSNGVS